MILESLLQLKAPIPVCERTEKIAFLLSSFCKILGRILFVRDSLSFDVLYIVQNKLVPIFILRILSSVEQLKPMFSVYML